MQRSGAERFLAILCAIAFSLSAIAAALWVSFDRELLVPSTYKNTFAQEQVYNRLPGIVAEQLVLGLYGTPCADNPLRCENAKPELLDCFRSTLGEQRYGVIAAGIESPNSTESEIIQACIDKAQPDVQAANVGSGVLSFFRLIEAKQLEKVITPLLPPDQMKSLADSSLDQVFPYLNGKRDSIILDLTGIKKSLAGPSGVDTVILILQSQPPCTFQQLQEFLQITLTGQGKLTLCNPSPELLGLLTPFIESQLKTAVDLIPDQDVITLAQGNTSTSYGPLGRGTLGGIRLGLLLLRLSPLVPLFFLLLVTLLVVRTFKDFLVWWGIPIFVAGLLVLVIGFSSTGLFEPAWVFLLTGRVPGYISLGLMGVIHDVVWMVMQTYWHGIEIVGGALALPGLIMWIGSRFVRMQ